MAAVRGAARGSATRRATSLPRAKAGRRTSDSGLIGHSPPSSEATDWLPAAGQSDAAGSSADHRLPGFGGRDRTGGTRRRRTADRRDSGERSSRADAHAACVGAHNGARRRGRDRRHRQHRLGRSSAAGTTASADGACELSDEGERRLARARDACAAFCWLMTVVFPGPRCCARIFEQHRRGPARHRAAGLAARAAARLSDRSHRSWSSMLHGTMTVR